MCFSFVIATLLEFAAVHYFTKVGYGEHSMPPGHNVGPDAALAQESLGAQTEQLDQQLREVKGKLRALNRRKQTPIKSRSVSNLQVSLNAFTLSKICQTKVIDCSPVQSHGESILFISQFFWFKSLGKTQNV